ncbi:MAG: argininosuccinate lyase [Micavibrio aeruginosavorus]|uniref:Argininosuccinate lyase n=1 Tax=Micavibrio aeruginosavorus TaxID=349221 RepID=A0A2W5MWU4_9BACT|nr:MAG: argininosuccinate lyase [Micavibrio aeruginosavorus]
MSKQPEVANKMWGGRFDAAASDIMLEINSSIAIDQRFYRQDITGSIAHARMLGATGIITKDESDKIIAGLSEILSEIESAKVTFDPTLEDIHMNVEHLLTQKIGSLGGKLHTARSRNDQVATDFRLWMRDAMAQTIIEIDTLAKILSTKASEHQKTVMPGFTHLQTAQPVTLGLHLDAYVRMLSRDAARMKDASDRMNECPLGACALAGTMFPIDRSMTAKELGFTKPMSNTMDAVGSRDFVLEFLSAAAICMSHLSRLAEELVLWSSTQFGYIRLPDSYTSGSSIMPQKKNADAAELVRGKSGRVTGNLMQMLMVMKALPLTYNKDMQEDKQAVFDSYDTLVLCLKAMGGMIEGMQIKADRMKEDAISGYSTATRLADWLVINLNIPFRDAHHITGKIVKLAERKGLRLDQLSLADYNSVEPRITEGALKAVTL